MTTASQGHTAVKCSVDTCESRTFDPAEWLQVCEGGAIIFQICPHHRQAFLEVYSIPFSRWRRAITSSPAELSTTRVFLHTPSSGNLEVI